MNRRTTTDQWNKIDEIFQTVVELPQDQQLARLQELAGDNEHLLSEVQSLLDYDRENGDSGLPAILPNQQPVEARQNIGDVVGMYRLLFPISVGSLSEVWCAEPSSSANVNERRVAIKFLRTKFDSEYQQRHFIRFAKEAHLLNRLRHPNIAELLEVGQTSEHTPYIVMRFVSGKPITEYADAQRLTLKERSSLMLKVCDAIEYAHRFLVVHRDLKPSNILVDQSGEPFVLDFGISKDLRNNDESNQSLSLTSAEERPMTPAYASPEQIRGEAITTATDVHGIGLLLYEIMSGHHPFSETCHPTTPHLFDRVCTSVPRLPSEVIAENVTPLESSSIEKPNTSQLIAAFRSAAPRNLKRKLKRGLDSVIAKAVSKAPEDRYRSVADLRNDLINVIENRTVNARVSRPGMAELIRKNPLYWTTITAAAAAFFATLVTAYVGDLQTKPERESFASMQIENEKLQGKISSMETDRDGLRERYKNLESAVAKAMGRNAKEFVNEKGNIEFVSPAMTAALARKAAENENFESARSLAQVGDAEKLPLGARIDLAVTYQLLGRPTRGLSILDDISPDNLDRESILQLTDRPDELQRIMMRLLIDAGRMREASKWWEFDLSGMSQGEQSADDLLMVAESRAGIGWIDGARQLLARINSSQRDLTSCESYYRDFVSIILGNEPSADFSTVNPVKHADKLICVKAMIQQATKHIDDREKEKASSLLDRAESLMNDTSLPDHFFSLLIIDARSKLAELEGDTKRADKLENRYWSRANDLLELGITRSVWHGIGQMESAKNREEVEQVLLALKPYAATYNSEPHLKRWIMIHQFQLDIDDKCWTRAHKLLNELCETEPALWEFNSLQNAYAVSAQAFVTKQLGSSSSQDHFDSAKRILKKLDSENSKLPASIFLRTAMRDGNMDNSGMPMHQWVNCFRLYSRNDKDDQLEMITFFIEKSNRTDDQDKQNLIFETANYFETNENVETQPFASRIARVVKKMRLPEVEQNRWNKIVER